MCRIYPDAGRAASAGGVPPLERSSRLIGDGYGQAGMDTLLRTLFGVPALCVTLIAGSILALVRAARGAPRERIDSVYQLVGRTFLRLGGTGLEVHGAAHAKPDQAYVVVANHESGWDPFPLIAGLPELPIRFVAKHALMQIPFFGAALRATGNVEVFRTDTAGDLGRLRDGMAKRDPRVSILFFAEGTRSRDGNLGAFKSGAFSTAIASRLPVLPVALAGTLRIWTKGIPVLRQGNVVIEVGEPIATDTLTFEQRGELRDRAREAVRSLRERARARLAEIDSDPRSAGRRRPGTDRRRFGSVA